MHQQHRYLVAPPLPDYNSTTAPVADYRSPRKTETRHNRTVQRQLRRQRRLRHLAELGLVAALPAAAFGYAALLYKRGLAGNTVLIVLLAWTVWSLHHLILRSTDHGPS